MLNEALEIAQILFHPSRETWGIENRTDFQRNLSFLFGARLEGNHAGHETIRQCSPRDPAAGNLKHNMEDALLVAAIGMPGIGKACVINSSYISQRRDEFRQVFNA